VTRFTATVDVRAPAERVWSALVDWPAHGRWVPLTRVEVLTRSGHGVGARFVGRTGVGLLAFDDPMEVVRWEPPGDGRPGRCAVVKQGRVVLGEAEFTVTALPDGRTRVVWSEDVRVAPERLTRPAGGLLAAVGRRGFERALRVMRSEVEAAEAASG
jgi:uncharacterized protein YndB with AHSA1/START domain